MYAMPRVPCGTLMMRTVCGVLCCHRRPFALPAGRGHWRLQHGVPVLGLLPPRTLSSPLRFMVAGQVGGRRVGKIATDGVPTKAVIDRPRTRQDVLVNGETRARRHGPSPLLTPVIQLERAVVADRLQRDG